MQKHDTTSTAAEQAAPESLYVTISEAAEILRCSYSSAQKAVAACNQRQKELGLFTLTGRCLRRCLLEYVGADRVSFFDGRQGARP